MSNLVNFATTRKTARAGVVNTALTSGTLKIYDGTKPTTPDTAVGAQNLLVTFALPNPAGTVTSGVFTAGTIASATVAYTSTAAWARAFDSSSGAIADFDVGVTGSGAAIEIDNLSLVSGGQASVTAFTITEG